MLGGKAANDISKAITKFLKEKHCLDRERAAEILMRVEILNVLLFLYRCIVLWNIWI